MLFPDNEGGGGGLFPDNEEETDEFDELTEKVLNIGPNSLDTFKETFKNGFQVKILFLSNRYHYNFCSLLVQFIYNYVFCQFLVHLLIVNLK